MVSLLIPNLRNLQKLMKNWIHKKVGMALKLSRNVKERYTEYIKNMTVIPVVRNLTVNLN